MKRTVKQRVDEFIQTKPKTAKLATADMTEIWDIGDRFSIIKYSFYLGYMKGQKARKGGAAK